MDTCNESNKTVFEGKDFNPPFKWGIHGICCNIPSNQKSFEDKQDFDETSELVSFL